MKKKILIVDDEAVVTRLISAILKGRTDYEIESTNNACEAFEWCYTRGYDLLISDVRMPLMDGDQMYAQLQELEKTGGKCPKLLLISGALGISELADRAGSVYFLQKPFVPELLIAQVNSILSDEVRVPRQPVSC